jgi:IS5 family transposase
LRTDTTNHDETADPGHGDRPRIRAIPQTDAARPVPGDDESHRAVGIAVHGGRAALPEAGQRPPTDWIRAHAAHSFSAALVQPGRSGVRRSAVRQRRLRRFAGIDLGREAAPDATSLLRFRHLLEQHQLGERLFAEATRVLQEGGMTLKTGTIVDATIIAAPSSTKNADKERDPEMHQTRKGKQWYFGMKLHIGVDSQSGLAHSAVVTPANVHDKHPLPQLLHGREKRVYGDSAYASQKTLMHGKAPRAKDFTNERVRRAGEVDEAKCAKNRNKSKNPGPGRACICRGQAAVGLYQGALPGPGQECVPRLHRAGIGEYLPGAPSVDGTGAPVTGESGRKRPVKRPQGHEITG